MNATVTTLRPTIAPTPTPPPVEENTQSLLEFGHTALAVLHDFTHMPDIVSISVAHPRIAAVAVGERYTLLGAYNLAVWAQALGQSISFQRAPLAGMTMRATFGGIRFEFSAGLYAGLVDEFERLSRIPLDRACQLEPADVLAALGKHPVVVAANR